MKRPREDVAWAAGLFEGEGSFSFARPGNGHIYGRAAATIAMTDDDVMRRFASIVGLGKVNGPRARREPERKPMYWWSVTSFEQVQAVLAMFWPWLSERRRSQALHALRSFEAGQRVKRRYWEGQTCEATDCERRPRVKGLCDRHYLRMRRARKRERARVPQALP